MKQKCITYSINCVISKYAAEVKSRRARKYNCLVNKSNAEHDVQSNPKNFRKRRHAPTFLNQKFSASLREYSTFRQRLWQSPTGSFHYTAQEPTTFFKRMKILIYYLFLEFDIANEKQTHNVN